MNGKPDTYTLEVLANFAADYGKDREFTRHAIQLLLDARTEKDELVWWTSEEPVSMQRAQAPASRRRGWQYKRCSNRARAQAQPRKPSAMLPPRKTLPAHGHYAGYDHGATGAAACRRERGSDVRGTLEITLNGQPVRS